MTKTGYIYKMAIKDGSIDDCYIGSTCRIRQRKTEHKKDCNNETRGGHNRFIYQFIRDNGGFNNWDLYELEKVEFEEKSELLKRERHYIELLKPKLNMNKPVRTREEQKEYTKIWNVKKREENPELYKFNGRDRMRKCRNKNKA